MCVSSDEIKTMMAANVQDTEDLVGKYFAFLETDFGFCRPNESWVSYEFHVAFSKGNIEIDIAVESDGTSMPWVSLIDYSQPADLDLTITPKNCYAILSLEDNKTITEIYKRRNERVNPKVDQFVKSFRTNNYETTHKELDEDYAIWGKNELETILRENAEIIKRHPEILSGDFFALPKREEPEELTVEIFEETEQGIRRTGTKRFKSLNECIDFVKRKQKSKQ